MNVVTTPPPNYAEIDAAFHIAGQQIVITYGDTIHNLSGNPITDHLMAHEQVHEGQQGTDPAGWWKRYIADPAFRMQQEIPAYQAQYRFKCGHGLTDHHKRMLFAMDLAGYLSSSMYGNAISFSEAMRLITQ